MLEGRIEYLRMHTNFSIDKWHLYRQEFAYAIKRIPPFVREYHGVRYANIGTFQ